MPFTDEDGRLVWYFETANGQTANVVQHFGTGTVGSLDLGVLQEVTDFCDTWWNTAIGGQTAKAFFNLNTTLVKCEATAFAQNPQLQAVTTIGDPGTAAGTAAPSESAVVVSWYTSLTGKSYRGRSFWPGFDVDQLGNDGMLTPTMVTNWNGIIQNLLDGLANDLSVPVELTVASRTLEVNNPITAFVVRPVIHHQSRRNT